MVEVYHDRVLILFEEVSRSGRGDILVRSVDQGCAGLGYSGIFNERVNSLGLGV